MQAPLINGVVYSWSQIKVVLFGVPVVGIVSIDYKRKQDKKNVWGSGKKAIGRGYGKEECEASIEIYQDVLKQLIAAAPNRDLLSIPPFDIIVEYGNSVANLTIDTIYSCEFLEDSFDSKQGDTSMTVKLPLVVADISR